MWGNTQAVFLQDQFKLTHWLTFNGGVRLTHFGGGSPPGRTSLASSTTRPIRASVRHCRSQSCIGWRAPSGDATTRRRRCSPCRARSSSSARQFDCKFAALHGERDEQHEFGLTIPLRGWTFDVSNFRTGARNFFDHDVLGNSNIFFPLTLERARIRGWEVTGSSPRLGGVASWHLAYSHQYAQWNGGITGGLVSDESCEDPICTLDHDQRDTLSTGVNLTLP